jgi:hypothetical protein
MSNSHMFFPASLLALAVMASSLHAQEVQPTIWMGPPSYDNARCFRELFENPDAWKDTRSVVDVLMCADHQLDRQFTDDELRGWFSQLQQWNLKFALEVGAVKPWGQTGEKTFAVQQPKWERFRSLGANLCAIAMDEPLLCCRKRKLPFSLIYWASEQSALARMGLADDSTWYVSIMQQGYDYAMVQGRPDQYVIESWIKPPSHSVPETFPLDVHPLGPRLLAQVCQTKPVIDHECIAFVKHPPLLLQNNNRCLEKKTETQAEGKRSCSLSSMEKNFAGWPGCVCGPHSRAAWLC